MQRTILCRTATRVILLCGICVLLSQERFQGAVAPTTYYVLGGGAGNCSGIEWSNAAGSIPAVLNPGDVVFIGNSGKNLADATTTPCPGEPNHTFSTSGSAGSHITIKAATAVDHGTATGWAASMGVDVNPKITWSNAFVPADGLKSPFWSFCPGSYYDVDGKVGSTDQTDTYGFYFKSAGGMFGFIKADPNDCSQASISNLTFTNIEMDGVEANSTFGGNAATALYLGSPVSTVATVNALSLTYFYIHDVFQPILCAGSMAGLTIEHGYIYTNFSNPTAHSQGLSATPPGQINTNLALNNLTVDATAWKNMQGTAVIVCLTGTCDNWKVYNNLFYYTSNWDAICEHGDVTASCGISKIIGDNVTGGKLTNSVIYGNTTANIHLKPGHTGGDEAGIIIGAPGSASNQAQNNIWWNSTLGDISANSAVAHNYNTWINTGNGGTTVAANEFQIGAAPGGVGVNPFAGSTDFHLSSETVDANLNNGVSLASPYNFDFASLTRSADGTWERGAYEFKLGGITKSASPTNLLVTGFR